MKQRISICLPYWERQAALDRMFANYAEQYSDLDLEFSVCDDGSPEPAKVPPGVEVTRLPIKRRPLNPCVPINAAVRASSADIVVLTNPEITHRDSVLPEMLELLQGKNDYVIAACRDVRRGGVMVAGKGVDYSRREPVPAGGHFHFLVMFHRSLWEHAGGFDEEYRMGQACDDNDWVWRLAAVGANFKLTSGVVQHHPSNITWKLPHNRILFHKKWPQMRRSEIEKVRGIFFGRGDHATH